MRRSLVLKTHCTSSSSRATYYRRYSENDVLKYLLQAIVETGLQDDIDHSDRHRNLKRSRAQTPLLVNQHSASTQP
ncbi:unnamed protein product [Mycena citricolor]|uniref:Uncharacterized protein n=1 Tax=Mycena citricolor TaxID=2018698 RepID=A0AAD2HX82_9AGAR|nr:unnamed protein product [Mycena citricolor]